MSRRAIIVALVAFVGAAPVRPNPVDKPAPADLFVVAFSSQLTLLGPDGKVKDSFGKHCIRGSFTPDRRQIATIEFFGDPGAMRGKVVIRPYGRSDEGDSIPLVFGTPARSGAWLFWSGDGKRLLICESDYGFRPAKFSYRVYEPATKKLTELKLPDGFIVTDWSADGKRFLGSPYDAEGGLRLAFIDAAGGKPEFIIDDAIALRGRLSPDGKRVLCMVAPKGKPGESRLTVIDPETKKRTVVDELGHTEGHCWSPDGSRIAYTWQPPLGEPQEPDVRETLLLTCRPDGTDRKTIASRKLEVKKDEKGRRGPMTFFFSIMEWR